jgi:hypothetical protein
MLGVLSRQFGEAERNLAVARVRRNLAGWEVMDGIRPRQNAPAWWIAQYVKLDVRHGVVQGVDPP